jgi:hypothetical protein
MDQTTRELLEKALSASTVSNTLVQQVIDKVVSFIFYSENPLRQNIPVKQGQGSAYIFNRRTASSTPGEAIADTGSFAEAEGNYVQVSLPYKIYGTSVAVTRFAQAIGRNYIDILQEEMSDKIIEFRDWEQKALIWGNYTGNNTEFSGATYADGFIKQIVNNGNGNFVLVGNSQGPGALTLAKLDEAIDKCQQMPNIIICSRTGRRILQGLLQAQQRFVNTVEIKGGFRVMEYAGIPVLTSTAIPDTCVYNHSGDNAHKYVTALTGGNSTVMLIMNLGDAFIAELESLTTKEVAQTTAQKIKYEIWEYITPVAKNPKNHCVVFGIATA